MTRSQYQEIEEYMKACMQDSAHDKEHIYRVLYAAMDIAEHEKGVDYDILIAACLLHDIGRQEQYENPKLCHAEVGSKKAYRFLTEKGWTPERAGQVRDCIAAHRFRKGKPPESLEAKILFDADKSDIVGAIGIARTLFYEGVVGEPLYTRREDGSIDDGRDTQTASFFREYHYKLKNIYDRFFTARGAQLAKERQKAASDFFEAVSGEVYGSYHRGVDVLRRVLS